MVSGGTGTGRDGRERYALQQCADDVQSTRGEEPSKAHLVAQRVEAVGHEAMQGWDDPAQSKEDEDLGARAPMRGLAVLRIEHDVRCSWKVAPGR